MTTKKFDAIVEIAGKVDANYAAQIEGYCSLLGEYGKKFETVCAMLALDLIRVKVFRYSDETAEAVASGEKLLKESGTIYESFADMMSPEDAKRYLDFLENGSREGLTSAELAGVEKADALRHKLGVPETDTIAVGKTDVKGMEGVTFEGQSPKVRSEAGLPDLDEIWVERNIKSPGNNPLFTRHAEEALANDNVSPGVLKQLSLKYPNLRIEVTSEILPDVKVIGKSNFVIQNGQYVE